MRNCLDTDDGPTAFPITRPGYETLGMTLRDYFAAAALNGLISTGAGNRSKQSMELLPQLAYMTADAMLAAREK